ncbi:MAG: hypothetical protein C0402_11370 [Thermodesulfovibrio sp.]|nr:hypothetical protein [Thermodesulfovibrio sp.]
MDIAPATGDRLRDNLCRNFCSFYKFEKKEEVTCLGYQAAAWLLGRNRQIDLVRREALPAPALEAVLETQLCPACPFFVKDCDYAEKRIEALPCGGFLLLKQLFGQGTVSIDDIRNFKLNLRATMKVYDLAELAREKGECILGTEELQTHACYMGFGILTPGEKNREIKPGSGHEEICCVVSGTVTLGSGENSFFVGPGQAFYLKGEQAWLMSNEGPGEAVYVLAGGHSDHQADH